MKVAVIIDNSSPEAGGGFTFQDVIFNKFIELSKNSKHNFFCFCEKNIFYRYKEEILKNKLSFCLYSSTGLIKNIFLKLLKYFPYLNNFLKIKSDLSSRISNLKIDFVWKICQGSESFDVPYVATVWYLMHLTHPWFPEVSSNRIWNRRESDLPEFCKRAYKVVTGTLAGKKEIQNFYLIPDERIEIIPHPVPELASSKIMNNSILLSIKKKILFYPAQFWPHKNHSVLFKTLNYLIQKNHYDFCLVLTGFDSFNKKHVESLVSSYNLNNQVYFIGFAPIEEIIWLYKNAFALVYPSYAGPENLPPLEAFYFGCPVVASKINGSDEQLGNAALLCNPSSFEEFAESLLSLKQDHELRSLLISRGLKKIVNKSSGNFVRRIFSIIDSFESIKENW
jgi:glycosyltransferase involved in cell wall biosynthesis